MALLRRAALRLPRIAAPRRGLASVAPLNLQAWLDEHGPTLQPPVANKLLFGGDLKVMARRPAPRARRETDATTDAQVVGGPNARRDYHLQTGEEFFLQLSGELCLKIVERGRFKDVRVGAGQTFLRVPPASQRSKGKQTVFPAGCRATCRTRRSAPRGRSASSLKDPTRPRRWTACSGSTRPRT